MSIQKLDSLLDGNPIKVTKIGDKKPGLLGAALVASALAIGAGGLYVYNHSDNSVSTQSPEIIASLKQKIQQTVESKAATKISNPIYGSFITNAEIKSKIEKAGNFDLPDSIAPNQIARTVAQIQFNEKNYLLSLVSEGENFRNHLYNDNIGFAFGNGWNLSMQNAAYNKNLASSISEDKGYIDKLTMLAGKTTDTNIPANFSNVTITPQRSIQVSAIMTVEFQKAVVKVIQQQLSKNEAANKLHKISGKDFFIISNDIFNGLKDNQKAALTYHAYKVGGAGFGKYTGLTQGLIDYALSTSKTKEKEKAIAEHFTYKYKMNGEIKEDIRASVLVSSMFLDEYAFGYVIGKNIAPKNMKESIPVFGKHKIEITSNSTELKIPDPVGDTRALIEKSGGKIDIQIIPEDKVYNITRKKNNPTSYNF